MSVIRPRFHRPAPVPAPVLVLVLALTLLASTAPAVGVERVERGNLVLEDVPEVPRPLLERLERYQSSRSANFSGWLPDGGGMLISTRFGETSQVHRVRFPLGAREQLTFFPEPVGGASPNPDKSNPGFVLFKDVGGSEFFQIYHFDLANGDLELLTDGASRNGDPTWSHAGNRLAFYTTRRNGRDRDLHVVDIRAPGPSKPILEVGGDWRADDWSRDEKRLLVTRFVSINEMYPHVLELETGKLTPVLAGDEPTAFPRLRFTRDGRGILFTSDAGSEFRRLQHLDLASGEVTVLSADLPWDVEGFDLARDGRHVAFSLNEDGLSRLYLQNLETNQRLPVPSLPPGQLGGLEFDPEGARLAFSLSTATTPGDVFSLTLATGELVRWTTSEVGGLDTRSFVEPQLVHFPTFDQAGGAARKIPAFYFQPPGEGPFPVLIQIHGGPESQWRPSFQPSIQYMALEQGIAVLAPNVRGSSGYGKTYLRLDDGKLREDSVKDIGALLDWIATRPELDASRVGVMGGSYGGYMVLASLVHYSHRLRAGVDVVGISNFVTFLTNTQPYRQDQRRAEYGDERDPAMRVFLEAISPTKNAARIKSPLLVAQGQNDPRVPVTESEQMVEVIRGQGGQVWYMLAKDEGHGFNKKVNRDTFQAIVTLFLERHLVPKSG